MGRTKLYRALIENVDQAGGCSYGYSCVYTDSISWASATKPLPMVRDPRVVFDALFGVGAPETVALLMKLGSKNSNKCKSC